LILLWIIRVGNTMGRNTNIAIIGCGWTGLRHAIAYRLCGANVSWAVVLDKRRASAIARSQPDTHVVQDAQVALEDPAVDAVSMCLPSALHAEMAILAAQAGKHILCEEPIATTLEDADAMVAAADENGVTLMIGANARFNPLYRNMKELPQEGVIGEPALVRLNRETYLLGSQHTDPESESLFDEGVMMSRGVQDIDIMQIVVGDINTIHASRAPQRIHQAYTDDTSIATLGFAGGAVGTLTESCASGRLETVNGKELHTFRVDGELGRLYSPDPRSLQLFSFRDDYLVNGWPMRKDIHVPEADTVLLEVMHFLKCIQTGQEPTTSGRLQRRSLELVMAAYRSMGTGIPVNIGYVAIGV
jgi:UDP-N-acetylglucosamine 3-dehydrogenase